MTGEKKIINILSLNLSYFHNKCKYCTSLKSYSTKSLAKALVLKQVNTNLRKI